MSKCQGNIHMVRLLQHLKCKNEQSKCILSFRPQYFHLLSSHKFFLCWPFLWIILILCPYCNLTLFIINFWIQLDVTLPKPMHKFFLGCLTPEDGTGRLSGDIGKKLPFYTTQNPKRVQTSLRPTQAQLNPTLWEIKPTSAYTDR